MYFIFSTFFSAAAENGGDSLRVKVPFHTHFWRLLLVLALTLVCSALFSSCTVSRPTGSAYVRVNQVGYITQETKQAILLVTGSESGATFNVINTQTHKSVYSAN